jgi:predicted TIM-barrel fold metal-dependent hydrolase
MIIDIHCHYTFTHRRANVAERFSFEPAERDGQPAFDSCLAPRVLRRWTWRVWPWLLGMAGRQRPGAELDRRIEEWYEQHLLARGPLQRCVLLAFDAYHDDRGRRPPFPETRRQRGSDMYTSNALIRATCRRYPDRYLFGASVHPYRAAAVACVDEVFAAGACLLKWIPQHQNIDCRDPRTISVLRRCAAVGLPLLLHYGPEFTLANQHPEYRAIAPLLDVLRQLRREGGMPTVIVAHVATPVTPLGDWRSYRLLVAALLGEFADAPLYADISALATWGKLPFLWQLAARQELHHKLLFGTDFPVPLATPRLWRDPGHAYRRVAGEASWPQRTLHIYRHLGFNEIVFHRAATLLPNVDYFARRVAVAGSAPRDP